MNWMENPARICHEDYSDGDKDFRVVGYRGSSGFIIHTYQYYDGKEYYNSHTESFSLEKTKAWSRLTARLDKVHNIL